MSSVRIAHGSLHHHGAGLLPDDLEGVDYLILDGGPVVAPDEEGPQELLEEAIRKLSPTLYLNPELKVIASLAGRDPAKAAERVGAILSETGNADLSIGVVSGSDVLDRLEELVEAGEQLKNDRTGEPFFRSKHAAVTASVLLGSEAVQAALQLSPRLILAGQLDALALDRAKDVGRSPKETSTPLHIAYRSGYVASELLNASLLDPGVARAFAKAWREKLHASGLPVEAARTETVQETESKRTSATITTYQADERDTAVKAHRLMFETALETVLDTGTEGLAPASTLRGGVRPSYSQWHTSISRDLVEWSVDVRPAKDWVD